MAIQSFDALVVFTQAQILTEGFCTGKQKAN